MPGAAAEAALAGPAPVAIHDDPDMPRQGRAGLSHPRSLGEGSDLEQLGFLSPRHLLNLLDERIGDLLQLGFR